ncbi:uncharacterized protein LOC142767757 [Rhipicephalus microplus]|uniref:uncharacterized protein LOC142767757 n=1 Tax=Rhipicephalus microplus TaxID=6941 RepID=UPI003F6D062B
MYQLLFTLLSPFFVSAHEPVDPGLPMWLLYDLLNTTHKIWILSVSQPVTYLGHEVSCLNYRTRNLTKTNVSLLYQAVWDKQVHKKITVKAQLMKYPYPTMKMRDWNGLMVKKELRHYSLFSKCGIFWVYLLDDQNGK